MAKKLLTKADKDRARHIADYRTRGDYIETDRWSEIYFLYLDGVRDGRRAEREDQSVIYALGDPF